MDRYGAEIVLLVSFIASAASYGLTASAQSMPLLYASSVPTLFQHAVLAIRVWVSNASSLEHRAAMLGYIGLAYSVGQVAGPFIGGQVGHIAGPRGPAFLAMWGSVLSAVTVATFLKGASSSFTVPNYPFRPSALLCLLRLCIVTGEAVRLCTSCVPAATSVQEMRLAPRRMMMMIQGRRNQEQHPASLTFSLSA